MIRHVLVTVLAAAASHGAHAEVNKFAQPGSITIDAGDARPATFQVICSPDRDGGALSIELVVPEANTRKDFDYDDFEGPDATGGDKAPARIAWTAADRTTSISHAAGGWYAPEPPDSFIFGISQLSHRAGPPAKLMSAAGAAGRLVWIQGGADRATRKLVATFDFDESAGGRLHAAVAPCLAPER